MGSKDFLFIGLEPNNLLVSAIPHDDDLFLPSNASSNYDQKFVNITIAPIQTDIDFPNKGHMLTIAVNCSNEGFKIKSVPENLELDFSHNEEDIKLSLLDYFDGFNMSYAFLDKHESIQPIDDNLREESYLLDSVTKDVRIKFGIIYEEDILVTFYNNGKIEVYDLKYSNSSISSYSDTGEI